MAKVRLAVIGIGNMGSFHCRSITKMEKAELTAVCDIKKDRADKFAEQCNCKAFYSVEDLFAAKVADAVIVAVPHYSHPDITIEAFRNGLHVLCEKPIAVCKSEGERMVAEHKKHPELRFVITTPREKVALRCQAIVEKFRSKNPNLPEIPVEIGKTAYYQQAAGTGLAASGTVTVESAIAGLPLVVTYKVSWISILIAALVVKLYRNSFVMPNIIANKKVYAEFLQHQVKPANLVPAMEAVLPGGAERSRVINDMQEVRTLLGDDGVKRKKASERAAEAVWNTLPPVLSTDN